MKISALRKMIHEEVRKAVRQELKAALGGGLVSETKQARKEEPSGLDEIRSRFRSTHRPSSLTDMYDGLDGQTSKSRPVDKPNNPKEILDNGEVFASGQGIMEWFKQSKGLQAHADHQRMLEQNAKADAVVDNIIKGNRRL